MKSSLVLYVLLGAVLSIRAASVLPSEPATVTQNFTTITPTTTPTTVVTPTCCMTTSTMPNTSPQAPPSQSQIMCPSGWEVFQGNCYYFVNEGMSWPQAQSNCALLGSMLTSVHSAQEYGFLQQLTSSNENQDAWLGGFFLQDQWLWLDGSWFYNTSWSVEYPGSSSPCLTLNSYGAWSNSPCNAGGYSSICVKESNVPLEMLCPEGWSGFQGRCFYYNNQYLSWPEADATCAGLDATLVSIHTPEEYSFLYQHASANGSPQSWLGGFYLDDQWVWLDGSWFYQGFYTAMSPDSSFSCLATYSAAGWSNYGCDQGFPFFCVKTAGV